MERPLDALNQAKGKRVIAELKNKRQVLGDLTAFDIHLNLVLDNSEERGEDGNIVRKLGRVFIRGDMILFISPSN